MKELLFMQEGRKKAVIPLVTCEASFTQTGSGATLLYLPPYSPDLNPIEYDFAALKKIRQFNHTKSIDQIVKMYK